MWNKNHTIDFNRLLDRYTLLYGEINTKKTLLTAKFIKFLLEFKHIKPKEISVLDFAPKLKEINNIKIGGKIEDYFKDVKKCNYSNIQGDIIPPRMEAKEPSDLNCNIYHNYQLTSEVVSKYYANPTPILIINDISIHLHYGTRISLIKIVNKSNTFFGNSYYGNSIKKGFSSLLDRKEKQSIEYLIRKKMDFTYNLDALQLKVK